MRIINRMDRIEPKEQGAASPAAWYATVSRYLDIPFLLNSTSSVGVRAVSGAGRALIVLSIARVYGPDVFGRIALAISVMEILRNFSEFGIDTVSIRRFAQIPEGERGALLEKIIGSKLLLATMFYCCGIAGLYFVVHRGFELQVAGIVGISLFSCAVLGPITSYLQSVFSMSRMFRIVLLGTVVSLVFGGTAMHFNAPVLLVICALPILDLVNMAAFSWRSNPRVRVRFSIRETWSLLRESLPVGFTVLLVILYFRLDNLFVFKFAGATALGLYAACYRLVEPALLVPQAFSTTAFSLLSGAGREKDGIADVARTVFRAMWPAYAFVGVVTSALLIWGQASLVRFLPQYAGAYSILVILAMTLMVRSLNVGITAIFNSRGRYSIVTKIAGINLAVNLILVSLLAPRYGAPGAAWAAFGTEFLNTLMQTREAFLMLKIPRIQLALQNIT